ncbi:MAG TPA: hypothetical protein VNB54_11185 [Alphaproteobacteria bacterium]|nr:hypothetical protein [Alphaproteobacteria bacterium]
MSLPNWTPPQTKLRIYEAVLFLNRSFEAAINAVDRLERLEFFVSDYLPALKTQVEYLRAEANSHLAENIQEYEEDETFRLEEIKREREKELADPDDVFFAARDREKEIKEKIKELQGGLARKHPKRKSRKARKKGKKRT